LSDPAEGKAHRKLEDSGENRESRLRAPHEVLGDNSHEGRLRDHSGERAKEAKRGLQGDGANEECDEGNRDVAEGHTGHGGDIEWQSKTLGKLAGNESADDRADSPAGFDETETLGAGVEDIVGEGHEDDIGTDDAGHEDGMRDAEGQDDGLLTEIAEPLLHIGINGEREPSFGDLRIFAGFEGLRGGSRRFGILTRILAMITRRDVTPPKRPQAIGRHEVGKAVDEEDAGDTEVVVEESDESAGEEHAGLYADENGGVGARELAGRDDFLDESVDVGPVHG